MSSYLPPLISLGLLAISFILCLHSLFSRRFFVWIIPFLMTLALGVFTFFILLPMISDTELTIMINLSGNPYAYHVFIILWFLMIVGFKLALGKPGRLQQTKKSRNEYEYLKSHNRKEIYFDQY